MQSIATGEGLAGDESRGRADDYSQKHVNYRPEATVHGLFRERAARHPLRTALLWQDGHMSYSELDRRSDAIAHRLLALGW